MKMQIQPIEKEEVTELRNNYLDSLTQPQELYLELFVRKSEFFIIQIDEINAGYFAVFESEMLTEFYIRNNFLPLREEIFTQIKKQAGIKKALCKSFDYNLLSASLYSCNKTEVLGYLFRDYTDRGHDFSDYSITCRTGMPADYDLVAEINEEVFETNDEIKEYLETGRVFMYYEEDEFVGFGICSVAVEGRPEHDIGMLVHQSKRRKGYGIYILNHLKEYCLSKGWRPTCGCAVDNPASKKTLEKAGFLSKYVMLEFGF